MAELVDTDLPEVKNMQSWSRQDVAGFLAEREEARSNG